MGSQEAGFPVEQAPGNLHLHDECPCVVLEELKGPVLPKHVGIWRHKGGGGLF